MSTTKPQESAGKDAPKPQGADTGKTQSASSAQGTERKPTPTLGEQMEALRKRAEAAEKERDDLRALAQQTRADFENYQKRSQRETAQERKYAHSPLALDFLPILDNFDRALQAAKQAGETGPLMQGVGMLQPLILDVLRRHGITSIPAQGQKFDPTLHEAVMQQPSAEHPPETVLQALEQGFTIHDRVLRPARVIVSVSPPSEEPAKPPE